MTDLINHPQHYVKHSITLEPIDILESLPFAVANIFKYVIRAKDKGTELEDLRKALWYLRRSWGKYYWNQFPKDILRDFYFFDIPMLRDFGFFICSGETTKAWAGLEVELEERIAQLEAEQK